MALSFVSADFGSSGSIAKSPIPLLVFVLEFVYFQIILGFFFAFLARSKSNEVEVEVELGSKQAFRPLGDPLLVYIQSHLDACTWYMHAKHILRFYLAMIYLVDFPVFPGTGIKDMVIFFFSFFSATINDWWFLILVPNTCVLPYYHLTFTLHCWTGASTGNARGG